MRKSIVIVACLLALVAAAQADTVTIEIDAGLLENTLGTAIVPSGGLLQLIASPSGTFSPPTSTSYLGGDNILVMSFGATYPGTAGENFNTLGLTLSSTLTAGEQLLLRFYPSLTFASMPSAPTLATSYGQVRSSTIEFGAAGGVPGETAWVVPGSSSTVNLEYITVSDNGTYSNISAYATNTVLLGVPEPSVYALFAVGVTSLLGLRLLSRRTSA